MRGEDAEELAADFKSTPRGMFVFAVAGFLSVLTVVDIRSAITFALIFALLSFPFLGVIHGLSRARAVALPIILFLACLAVILSDRLSPWLRLAWSCDVGRDL